MEQWTKVAPASDISANCVTTLQVEGTEIIVYQTEGNYYVYSNRCTHQDVPLSDGYLVGDAIICRLHGAKFDLKSGACLRAPARGDLQAYQAMERDGYLFVRPSKVGEKTPFPARMTFRSFYDTSVAVNA